MARAFLVLLICFLTVSVFANDTTENLISRSENALDRSTEILTHILDGRLTSPASEAKTFWDGRTVFAFLAVILSIISLLIGLYQGRSAEIKADNVRREDRALSSINEFTFKEVIIARAFQPLLDLLDKYEKEEVTPELYSTFNIELKDCSTRLILFTVLPGGAAAYSKLYQELDLLEDCFIENIGPVDEIAVQRALIDAMKNCIEIVSEFHIKLNSPDS